MPRYVLITTLACMATACGSEDRGITQPTPSSAPWPSVVYLVHNTLNPPDNRASRRLLLSAIQNPTPGPSQSVPLRVYDDFTSAVTTAIRTVSWQGGYCGGSPAVGPLPPPVATSPSFQIAFHRDSNGSPSGSPSLADYDVTLTPADAHEQFAFDTGPTTGQCTSEAPNASYYDYTAVLPSPFPITAGVRYWLSVRADMRNAGASWGWRVGMRDNNHSKVNAPQSSLLTTTFDLAFSLSDR